MKALSLYSGGCDGMSLAASWLGIETVAFCDSEPACRAVLAARHPDAPIFTSDEDVTLDGLRAVGVDPAGIDLVMGGPPCQCASVAGKRLGAADPRNRWPQYIRIVREVRPRWIMAENSPGLLTVDDGRLFGDILRGLAEAGYSLCWDCWGAGDVGAPHQRDRLFILGELADANGRGQREKRERRNGAEMGERRTDTDLPSEAKDGNPLAHTDSDRSDARRAEPAGFSGEAGADGGCDVANPDGERGGGQEVLLQLTRGADAFGASEVELGNPDRERFQERVFAAVNGAQGFTHWRSYPRRRTGRAQPRLGRDTPRLPSQLDETARRLEEQRWPAGKGAAQYDWEPPRVAQGIPDRATRLKMIGNACPPQQYLVGLTAIRIMHDRRKAHSGRVQAPYTRSTGADGEM